MTDIQEGVVQIIQAPQRGRHADPIPAEIIQAVLDTLPKVEKGQMVSTGKLFPKKHQAQAFGRRLLDELVEKNKDLVGKLGTSVPPVNDEAARKDAKGREAGPFVLAVRKS
jgi:hypothetical protein